MGPGVIIGLLVRLARAYWLSGGASAADAAAAQPWVYLILGIAAWAASYPSSCGSCPVPRGPTAAPAPPALSTAATSHYGNSFV